MLKKLPLPIAGLMLGMAALGNLIQSYSNNVRMIFGIISAVIGVLIICKIIKYPGDFKEEMKNPVIASVFGTFPMALMLLSGYIKPFVGFFAPVFYYGGVIIHICLIIYFTINFIFKLNIKKVFASYYIVFVGIVVASVSAGVVGNKPFGKICFWFGFVTFLMLLCLVGYRYLKYKEVPEMLQPLFCIMTAPASLLLAGYMQSFDKKNLTMVYFLLILSQILYVLVLSKIFTFLKLKFYPSYSAFTFPFVITAISLKMTNVFLNKSGNGIGFLKYVVIIETIIATVLTLYTLVRYCTNSYSK